MGYDVEPLVTLEIHRPHSSRQADRQPMGSWTLRNNGENHCLWSKEIANDGKFVSAWPK